MKETSSAASAVPFAPGHLQSPNLRIAISTALRRHGIAPTRFGREAVRDPRFVLDIFRHNREPRPATAAKVRAYIASLGEKAHG